MLEFKRLDVSNLSQEEWESYKPLILPSALETYANPPLVTSYWILMEARLGGELVGAALAEFFAFSQIAQLHSLIVKEAYRSQNIGFKLVQELDQSLKQQDRCLAFGFDYEEAMPSAPALEKIAHKMGWRPPKLHLLRCHFNAYEFNPTWMRVHYPFPSEFQIFSWKEVTSDEKQIILSQADQGRFSPNINPFDGNEAQIESINSLGLRYKGDLVGWNITHRIGPETIRYSKLYIDRDFHLAGYAIVLLIKSIRLQQAAPGVPYALFEINMREIELSWWRFVKKRLIPYAKKVDRIRRAFHVTHPSK